MRHWFFFFFFIFFFDYYFFFFWSRWVRNSLLLDMMPKLRGKVVLQFSTVFLPLKESGARRHAERYWPRSKVTGRNIDKRRMRVRQVEGPIWLIHWRGKMCKSNVKVNWSITIRGGLHPKVNKTPQIHPFERLEEKIFRREEEGEKKKEN